MIDPKDEKIKFLTRFSASAVAVLVAVIIGFALMHHISVKKNDESVTFLEPTVAPLEEETAKIIIHIKGEVLNPGVYEIGGDLRLKDAVNAAGGFTENADFSTLNLAMFINDGDEIIIPRIGANNASVVTPGSSGDTSSKITRININTASLNQLMTLPGIGQSIAERIIQYRTQIPFKSPEDIKNVSGIGNSKYDKIKDYIYVK